MSLRKNPYLGINAHLHSYLQKHGNWKVFHNKHISDIAEALDGVLPPGYEVGLTDSLQIVEYHPDTGKRAGVILNLTLRFMMWERLQKGVGAQVPLLLPHKS